MYEHTILTWVNLSEMAAFADVSPPIAGRRVEKTAAGERNTATNIGGMWQLRPTYSLLILSYRTTYMCMKHGRRMCICTMYMCFPAATS